MKKPYFDVKPHEEAFLYRRLQAVCPVTRNGRDMEIALVCDADSQTAQSVAYAFGPEKDKWDDRELAEGRVKIPRS